MRPKTRALSARVPPAAIPPTIAGLSPPDPPGVVTAEGTVVTERVCTVGTEVTRVFVYVIIVGAYRPGAVSKEDVTVLASTAVDST